MVDIDRYTPTSKRRAILPAIAGIALGFGGRGVLPSSSSNRDTSGSRRVDETKVSDITATNRPLMGSNQASVVFFYWGDYQCPFCAKFETETLPRIRSSYIQSTDLIFIYKPIAVFGKDSRRAAQAAHAVWDQEGVGQAEFWQWHATVQSTFNGNRNSGWATASNLQSMAKRVDGVSPDPIESAVNNSEYSKQIRSDAEEARGLGANGTPFSLITSSEAKPQTLAGAQPFSRFQSVINRAMDADGGNE